VTTALLLVDVVNDFEFDGAERMLPGALRAARRIAGLKQRTAARGIPAVYANDNYGRWRSDFAEQVRRCLEEGVRGRPLVEMLRPGPRDYFVLKPLHSAFYGTPLHILLRNLKVTRLIVTGFATDNCVLFTASDAYLRGFELVVPRDCVAAETGTRSRLALSHMRRVLKARTVLSSRLTLPPARGRARRRR
jgi:nicotinamidase-related amidase